MLLTPVPIERAPCSSASGRYGVITNTQVQGGLGSGSSNSELVVTCTELENVGSRGSCASQIDGVVTTTHGVSTLA